MSTLFVDTINEKTSGNGVAIPGHIVNYEHLDIRTTTNIATTNTATDLSGGSLNYTPKAAGNKLIVTGVAHVFLAVEDTSWTAVHIQLVIDGNTQDPSGSATTYGTAIRDTGNSNSVRHMAYAQTIDEYTTTGTSQIVIKLQANRTQGGASCSLNEYGKGSITVMEIAQ